jgi:S1-C subfamily serine protease
MYKPFFIVIFSLLLFGCGEDAVDHAFKKARSGDKAALKVLQTQSEKNNAKANRLLGTLYLYGQGVNPNPDKAIALLTIAANLGDKPAIIAIEKIQKDGIPTPKELPNINNKNVEVNWKKPNMPDLSRVKSVGSSVAINKDGFFLTNWHVVQKCSAVFIKYNNNFGQAVLVGKNDDIDVAVLKVKDETSPHYIRFASKNPSNGERLYVGGYPLTMLLGSSFKFSDGVVAGYVNSIPEIFQMTASISSGNSGGPVVDTSGKLIGISVAGIAPGTLGRDALVGGSVNFAVNNQAIRSLLAIFNIPFVESNNQNSYDSKLVAKYLEMTSGLVICF